ncbi:MAG TPA: hypothetical protein VM911_21700 [Pyrinomonadaceae bacterium]|nr:hypothetical protein [Pyrinomonadaceae bacterium]
MNRKRTASTDRLTVIAIAVIAYAGVNVCHEIVGHCGMAAILGTRCIQISSTNIPLITFPPAWKYNIIVIAGSSANWAVGLVCLGLLRALRTTRTTPALRYFLWLSMCVNLFLASTYMTAAPIIKYGDSYILIRELPGQLFWRSALVLAGGALCWFSFQICRTELSRLIGFGGRAAREVAWELVVPAYIIGGVVTVTSALFSQLDFKIAQLQAAGGTFGLTAWLLLLPLCIPEAPASAEHPFIIPRSIWWIVAGALVGLIFIGVLGPGIVL